jgi:hypothetical protein
MQFGDGRGAVLHGVDGSEAELRPGQVLVVEDETAAEACMSFTVPDRDGETILAVVTSRPADVRLDDALERVRPVVRGQAVRVR